MKHKESIKFNPGFAVMREQEEKSGVHVDLINHSGRFIYTRMETRKYNFKLHASIQNHLVSETNKYARKDCKKMLNSTCHVRIQCIFRIESIVLPLFWSLSTQHQNQRTFSRLRSSPCVSHISSFVAGLRFLVLFFTELSGQTSQVMSGFSFSMHVHTTKHMHAWIVINPNTRVQEYKGKKFLAVIIYFDFLHIFTKHKVLMQLKVTFEEVPKHKDVATCIAWSNVDEVFTCG